MLLTIRLVEIFACLYAVRAQRCTAIAFSGYDQCGLYCRLSLAAGASYRARDRTLANVSDGLGEADAVATFGLRASERCVGEACSDDLEVLIPSYDIQA